MEKFFISTAQRTLLGHGRVPQRRQRTIRRLQVQERLCQTIKDFLKKPESRWLLVHGMPGCGKTRLVADLLWEKPEICFGLFERIIWLMDQQNPTHLAGMAVDTLLLLSNQTGSVVQTDDMLAQELEPTNSMGGYETIQQLGLKLKNVLQDGMMKTLLVLDEVVSEETVRFFDEYKTENCMLLATSTNLDIFSMVDGLEIFRLDTDELLVDELRQLVECYGLENFTDQFLQQILTTTGGNLALLEKLLTMAKGNQKIFSTLLTNFAHFRPLHEFSVPSFYRHANLERPIQSCVKMLPDYIAQNLEYFDVLERHTWTPFEILSLIWPLDFCGHETKEQLDAMVLHQLQTIARNSLLDSFCHNQPQTPTQYFRLQPLIHSFLMSAKQNFHMDLEQKCNFFLSNLKEKVHHQQNDQFYFDYLKANEKRLRNLMQFSKNSSESNENMEVDGNQQMNEENGWKFGVIRRSLAIVQFLMGRN